jgi:hypothetical protein
MQKIAKENIMKMPIKKGDSRYIHAFQKPINKVLQSLPDMF